MLDDKDLEIARLKGKVEALEGELAKERAARHVAWASATVCLHLTKDATGRCMQCGLILPKPQPFTTTVEPFPMPHIDWIYTNVNAAACNPIQHFSGMTIWSGGPRAPGGATS